MTHRKTWLLASTIASVPFWLAAPARAQTDSSDARISAIEAQIKSLQSQLQQVTRELHNAQAQVARESTRAREAETRAAQTTIAPRAAPLSPGQNPQYGQAAPPGAAVGPAPAVQAVAAPPSPPSPPGQFQLGGVSVQLGGFVEAAGIFRSRNETADIASNFNAIPLPNSPQYHQTEFRGTARQSRLSLLIGGKPSDTESVAAYGEFDLQGAGANSNSLESNSYVPRVRQAYATYDNSDWGLHVLGGQAWSLLTMSKNGMVPRQENIPLTIDAQYVVGFDWARQAQLRVAKSLDEDRIWLGASLEEPQTNYYVGPNGTGVTGRTVTTTSAGGSGFSSSTNYSSDVAPDLVVKATWDPGFGHYEAYGVGRLFRTRVSSLGSGQNETTVAGGGGAAVLLPVLGNDRLNFQASALAGEGIGRYGSGQLPDATVSQSGSAKPLPEVMALAGFTSKITPRVQIYAYGGTEQIIDRAAFVSGGRGFGYGSPLYVNTGCSIELSTAGCVANTSGLVEGTLGAWWTFLKGNYGSMRLGAQYAYVKRDIFSGVGGGPSTDDNIVMVSFRYYPFE
ncbi:MAG: hypothetical protein JOZ42_04545 [Acetobacteraceae bacterium]|nr:hypothetical protein [Acetobacteraceae bacterium]